MTNFPSVLWLTGRSSFFFFFFFFFFHGKLILSVAVSTTDRQASRLAAFLQAKDWSMFKGLKSDSTARNQVCLGRPTGRLQSGGGFRDCSDIYSSL